MRRKKWHCHRENHFYFNLNDVELKKKIETQLSPVFGYHLIILVHTHDAHKRNYNFTSNRPINKLTKKFIIIEQVRMMKRFKFYKIPLSWLSVRYFASRRYTLCYTVSDSCRNSARKATENQFVHIRAFNYRKSVFQISTVNRGLQPPINDG